MVWCLTSLVSFDMIKGHHLQVGDSEVLLRTWWEDGAEIPSKEHRPERQTGSFPSPPEACFNWFCIDVRLRNSIPSYPCTYLHLFTHILYYNIYYYYYYKLYWCSVFMFHPFLVGFRTSGGARAGAWQRCRVWSGQRAPCDPNGSTPWSPDARHQARWDLQT